MKKKSYFSKVLGILELLSNHEFFPIIIPFINCVYVNKKVNNFLYNYIYNISTYFN